jgi:hypothetical protein
MYSTAECCSGDDHDFEKFAGLHNTNLRKAVATLAQGNRSVLPSCYSIDDRFVTCRSSKKIEALCRIEFTGLSSRHLVGRRTFGWRRRGRESFSAKRQAIIIAVWPKKTPDPVRCAVQLEWGVISGLFAYSAVDRLQEMKAAPQIPVISEAAAWQFRTIEGDY